MLNSIGIPLLGPAPPPAGGAAIEQPTTSEGSFGPALAAALLAAGSPPASETPTVALEIAPSLEAGPLRGAVADLGTLIDGAPAFDGGTATPGPERPLAAGPNRAVPAASSEPFVVPRPDRSSEAEVGAPGSERSAELEVKRLEPEGSPLAALLVAPVAPPELPPTPEPTPAATTLDAVALIEASPLAADVAPPPPSAVGDDVAISVARGEAGSPAAAAKPQPPGPEASEAVQRPAVPDRPESARAPEERLSEQLRTLEPQERAELASAWNRAGGRFEGEPPSSPSDPAQPATPAGRARAAEPSRPAAPPRPAQSAERTPDVPAVVPAAPAQPPNGVVAAPSVGRASIEEPAPPADGVVESIEITPSTRSAAPASEDAPPSREPIEATPPLEANAGPALAAAQRPIEAAAPRVEQHPPPLEARDSAALQRGLADSVRAAVRRGDDSIRLVLNPPQLGHLDIRVTTGTEGVRIDVAASTAEATDLIRQHLPALVAGLEARDLRVDRAEVRQALGAEFGAGLGSREPRSGSRQPGERGESGNEDWARPEWSGVAALERAAARATARRSEQAGTRLLDLVA